LHFFFQGSNDGFLAMHLLLVAWTFGAPRFGVNIDERFFKKPEQNDTLVIVERHMDLTLFFIDHDQPPRGLKVWKKGANAHVHGMALLSNICAHRLS
jgi:hypothetical protein